MAEASENYMSVEEITNLMDKMVIPPPLSSVIRKLDDNAASIPGEIKISPQGRLLGKSLEFNGFLRDLIDIYDNWASPNGSIAEKFASVKINIPDSNKFARFKRIYFDKPRYLNDKGERKPLYPNIARLRHLSYQAEIYGELVISDGVNDDKGSVDVLIGKIPAMLGSNICWLHNKTDLQRYELGEDPKDHLGYFIIRGVEKNVIIQEKLRLNRFFVFKDKDLKTVCKMTCGTINGSSVVYLSSSENKGIRLNLHFLKDNSISLFQAYRLLGISDYKNIIKMITFFVTPRYTKKIWIYLQPTILEYQSVGDDIAEISRMIENEKLSPSIQKEYIVKSLIDELFPQMDRTNVANKLYMLSLMAATYIETLAGLRGLDNRDDWGNKRMEPSGRSMETLFNKLLNDQIENAELSLNKMRIKGSVTVEIVGKTIDHSIITDQLVIAFNSGNWGTKNGVYMENITDTLKRESIISTYSQMVKINTPTSKEVKQPEIRMVQNSQYGYVCPAETPEGGQCGLVKYKAVSCFISLARPDITTKYLSKYISGSYAPGLAWCSL